MDVQVLRAGWGQVALCMLFYTTLPGHHSLICQPLGLCPSVTLGEIVRVSLIIPVSLLSP